MKAVKDETKIPYPTCVGGPECGREVTGLAGAWTLHITDRMRQRVHTYERRSPTDPAYYHRASSQLIQGANYGRH